MSKIEVYINIVLYVLVIIEQIPKNKYSSNKSREQPKTTIPTSL